MVIKRKVQKDIDETIRQLKQAIQLCNKAKKIVGEARTQDQVDDAWSNIAEIDIDADYPGK